MLKLIACHQLKQDNDFHILPKKRISVAEVLEEDVSDRIYSAFLQTVHQIYQCTEGFLCYTCKFGHLHLNEDLVKIEKEYIAETRFYPIITDFNIISQPIIRYKLNDILRQLLTAYTLLRGGSL